MTFVDCSTGEMLAMLVYLDSLGLLGPFLRMNAATMLTVGFHVVLRAVAISWKVIRHILRHKLRDVGFEMRLTGEFA